MNSGGCTDDAHNIRFWSMAGHGNPFIMMGNVIHELGHAYNLQLGSGPANDIPDWMYDPANPGRLLFLQPNSRAPGPNRPFSPKACDECPYWQFNRSLNASETFADIFVAWTYGVWNTSTDIENVNAVRKAKDWARNWLPTTP